MVEGCPWWLGSLGRVVEMSRPILPCTLLWKGKDIDDGVVVVSRLEDGNGVGIALGSSSLVRRYWWCWVLVAAASGVAVVVIVWGSVLEWGMSDATGAAVAVMCAGTGGVSEDDSTTFLLRLAMLSAAIAPSIMYYSETGYNKISTQRGGDGKFFKNQLKLKSLT